LDIAAVTETDFLEETVTRMGLTPGRPQQF
jgi:hypothetical protein